MLIKYGVIETPKEDLRYLTNHAHSSFHWYVHLYIFSNVPCIRYNFYPIQTFRFLWRIFNSVPLTFLAKNNYISYPIVSLVMTMMKDTVLKGHLYTPRFCLLIIPSPITGSSIYVNGCAFFLEVCYILLPMWIETLHYNFFPVLVKIPIDATLPLRFVDCTSRFIPTWTSKTLPLHHIL